MRPISRRVKTLKAILRLADLFEPRLQFGYLFSLDSELLTAVEAMHMVYVLELAKRLGDAQLRR